MKNSLRVGNRELFLKAAFKVDGCENRQVIPCSLYQRSYSGIGSRSKTISFGLINNITNFLNKSKTNKHAIQIISN